MPDRQLLTGGMRAVSYARLPRFPKLFSTYCEQWELLADYFEGDWRQPSSYRSVARRLSSPISASLADALVRQNAAWGNDVLFHIQSLRTPGALAVVTGQQVGLYGGPLYTLYKALTAVRLAEHLSVHLDRPVVPVFWMEGGDHDLDEVSTLALPGAHKLQQLHYHSSHALERGNLGSVGRLRFGADLERIRDLLRQALPATEYRRAVLDEFYGAYQTGTTFTDAFAQTLAALMRETPLVLMDPEDPQVKPLAVPLFERALLEHVEAHARVLSTSQALARAFHAQVTPRATNLFYQDEYGRNALRPNGTGFTNAGSGERLSVSDAAARIRTHAHRFSPNVVLRPLVQDSLLPTVAYVAGPGEVSYFAQFKQLYAWADIVMPIIYPRASLTIIEPREQRLLRKHALDLADLQEEVETTLSRLLLTGSSVESAFQQAESALRQAADALYPAVTQADATLAPSAAATHAAWSKALGKLQSRVIRAEKRKHEALRIQLRRTQQALYPGGKLQERVLPAVYFLSKYGPAFLQTLRKAVTLDTGRHHTLLL